MKSKPPVRRRRTLARIRGKEGEEDIIWDEDGLRMTRNGPIDHDKQE